MSEIKDALWAGALAVVEGLPRWSGGGSRRQCGEYTDTGFGEHATRTVFAVGEEDGTDRVYEITVCITERIDTHDTFWGEVRAGDDVTKRVVVGNEHYLIGPPSYGGFQGFGGRRWEIEFFDGRRVVTNNLWHQGTIPPKWRERYPDNARFVPSPVPEFSLSGLGVTP